MVMGNRKRKEGVERCEIIEEKMNEWVYRIGAVVVTQTLKWRQWTTRTYIKCKMLCRSSRKYF